jgi:16S rRNA (guanine527-N7)-methyltransferase
LAEDGLKNVSRETVQKLKAFERIVLKWNRTINLVSRGSENDLWDRHILDSAQLWTLRPSGIGKWADLGSGGGFPGLVVAILAQGAGQQISIALVESDARKCAFLLAAKTELGLDFEIVDQRIETSPPLLADVLSARALAPLSTLLHWAEKHRRRDGICLFPKGETVHNEIEAARQNWSFNYVLHPSRTRPDAAIVEIGGIRRD